MLSTNPFTARSLVTIGRAIGLPRPGKVAVRRSIPPGQLASAKKLRIGRAFARGTLAVRGPASRRARTPKYLSRDDWPLALERRREPDIEQFTHPGTGTKMAVPKRKTTPSRRGMRRS